MYLSHLSLTHFRNYAHLEFDFQGALTLLQGENAQGKTNLLEAIYFLATSKPVHAVSEREVVDWAASNEPIPYARVAAVVQVDGRSTQLEILLSPREGQEGFRKQVRINGVARRAMDLVGQLRAVLFLPEDIRLVDGSPGERRRHLDIALCQMDRGYCRALSQFQRVLEQRNSLLRGLREQGASAHAPGVDAQLGFWDGQLVALGSTVIAARYRLLRDLEESGRPLHAELSGEREQLALQYLPSFNPGHLSDTDFAHLSDERFAADIALQAPVALEESLVAAHFGAKLRQRRAREIDAGTTLYGPHRDDFRFLVNGRNLRLYGSRGQQRSGALAVKLAEVHVMSARTGSAPILLLDDVMSELDAQRRSMLLRALEGVRQSVLTTTDWEDFSADFRARASRFIVQAGTVHAAGQSATEGVPPTALSPASPTSESPSASP